MGSPSLLPEGHFSPDIEMLVLAGHQFKEIYNHVNKAFHEDSGLIPNAKESKAHVLVTVPPQPGVSTDHGTSQAKFLGTYTGHMPKVGKTAM